MKNFLIGMGIGTAFVLAHRVIFGSLDVSSYLLGVIQTSAIFVVNELRGRK